MTPEEFQQTMDSAREGVQQLALEKEIILTQPENDEITSEYVKAHMDLFKRLIKIVDNVLSVVKNTDDNMVPLEEEEEDDDGAESGNKIDRGKLRIKGWSKIVE